MGDVFVDIFELDVASVARIKNIHHWQTRNDELNLNKRFWNTTLWKFYPVETTWQTVEIVNIE